MVHRCLEHRALRTPKGWVLDQAVALLRRRGRVTYRAIKREFNLDDACLEDLKDELVNAQHLAVDEHGTVLVSALRTTPQSPASR
jgi:hypothetical protein